MIGRDTDYLCRLAGQLPPFNLYSIATLRDRALEELGFADLSSDTLICYSVASLLHQHRNDASATWKVLDSAKCLYVARDISELQPLYLLWHGLDELKQFGEQWYVDDMGHANATEVTDQIIDAFIKSHSMSS